MVLRAGPMSGGGGAGGVRGGGGGGGGAGELGVSSRKRLWDCKQCLTAVTELASLQTKRFLLNQSNVAQAWARGLDLDCGVIYMDKYE